jgi:hypothetical protein
MRKELKTIEEAQSFVDALYKEEKYIIEVLQLAGDSGYAIQWQEHKSYTAYDGKVWPDEVWRTEDGRLLQIQDIDPEHCRNILRMMLRQEREAEARLKVLTDTLRSTMDAMKADLQAGSEDTLDGSFIPASSDKPIIH